MANNKKKTKPTTDSRDPKAVTAITTRRRRSRSNPSVKVDRLSGVYGSLGYKSGAITAYEGRSYTGGSGSAHEEVHRLELYDQARDFARNNGLFKGPRERILEWIFGTGFKLVMQTDDDDFNKQTEDLWADYWGNKPNANGTTGMQTEYMWGRERLTVGDVGANKLRNGKLQIIEAEQICSKKNPTGIIANKFGEPKTFLLSRYEKGYLRKDRAKRVNADSFLFCMNPDRPSSIRTMPPLQDAFAMLHRLKDVIDSEAIARQIMSKLTLMINSEDGPAIGASLSGDDPSKDSLGLEDDLARRLVELDLALIFFGKPGDEIKGIDRNIPGANFSENLRAFLQIYSVSWGLPLELLLLDFTKANFSQSRFSLTQAFQTFIKEQKICAFTLHVPTVKWKISRWIRAGRYKSVPADAMKHDWILPTFPWIEHVKEAQAYGIQMDRSFTTLSAVCKSQNTNRETILKQRKKEFQDGIDIARDLYEENKEFLDATVQTVSYLPFVGMKALPEKGRPPGAAPAGGANGAQVPEKQKGS